MKVKTSELTGAALDWAVAKCEGKEAAQIKFNGPVHLFRKVGYDPMPWQPSTDWAQGGPIVEREMLDVEWTTSSLCRASYDWLDEAFFEGFGPTPLIAAMRCYVASKMGGEIDIPKELKNETENI